MQYEIIHRHLNAVGIDIWLKVFHAYRFLRHTYIMTTRSSMIPTNDRMEERQLAWDHLFDSVPDPIKERFFPPYIDDKNGSIPVEVFCPRNLHNYAQGFIEAFAWFTSEIVGDNVSWRPLRHKASEEMDRAFAVMLGYPAGSSLQAVTSRNDSQHQRPHNCFTRDAHLGR